MFFISRVRPGPRYPAPPRARAHRVNHAEPWTWETVEVLNYFIEANLHYGFC